MTGPLSGVRTGLAALVALAAMGLAGCGTDDTSPAAEVPSLGTLLATVDGAIEDGRYVVARRQLDALVEATIESRDSGELDGDDADRILAAAAELRALLPDPLVQTDDEDPDKSPSPEPDRDGSGGGGGGGGGGGDGDNDGKESGKPGKGKGKGHGKGGKR